MKSKLLTLLSVGIFALGIGAAVPGAAASNACRNDCYEDFYICLQDSLPSQCNPPLHVCLNKCPH